MATTLPIFDSSKIDLNTVAVPAPIPSAISTVVSPVTSTVKSTVSSVSNFLSFSPTPSSTNSTSLPSFNQTFSNTTGNTNTAPSSINFNNPEFLSGRSATFSITSAPVLGGTATTSPDLALTPKVSINLGAAITNPSSLNLSNLASGAGVGLASALGAPTTLAGAASALGVPTTIGGAATALGLPTGLPPVGQALNTLGIPTNFRGLVNLTGLKFPKIPGFPGIDLIGINLGAGKKWIAEQIAKYKLIVPPFVPGLKINMAVALAAVSVLRAAAQVGPEELVKHLLSSIVDDLQQEVVSQLDSQLKEALTPANAENIQFNLGGVVDGAKNSFVSNYNLLNPPQTTTNEDGDTITIPPPPPDVSGFPKVEILPKNGEGILANTKINTIQFSGTPPLSQAKAFTFPPTG